jgi:hypothetical protein
VKKRYLVVIAVGILALVQLFPMGGGQIQVSAAAPLASSSTRFRVVIAETLSASANIYLDGVIVNANTTPPPTPTPTPIPGPAVLPSLNASGYITTTGGSHTVSLTQAGTTTAFTGVLPFTFSPVAGTNYTLVLLSGNTWITIVDPSTAPAAGTANARVINLSANNNPVSVDIDGVSPIGFASVAYQTINSTTSVYASVTAASHTITAPGSNANPRVFLFQAGHVYTIFLFFDTTKNQTVILPKNDTIFAVLPTSTPTATSTSTPTSTPTATPTLIPPTPTSTPTRVPTVGVPEKHIFLPLVSD